MDWGDFLVKAWLMTLNDLPCGLVLVDTAFWTGDVAQHFSPCCTCTRNGCCWKWMDMGYGPNYDGTFLWLTLKSGASRNGCSWSNLSRNRMWASHVILRNTSIWIAMVYPMCRWWSPSFRGVTSTRKRRPLGPSFLDRTRLLRFGPFPGLLAIRALAQTLWPSTCPCTALHPREGASCKLCNGGAPHPRS
jgi:hypothetical protein